MLGSFARIDFTYEANRSMLHDRIIDPETGAHLANIVDDKVLAASDHRHVGLIKEGNAYALNNTLIDHFNPLDHPDDSAALSNASRQPVKANDG